MYILLWGADTKQVNKYRERGGVQEKAARLAKQENEEGLEAGAVHTGVDNCRKQGSQLCRPGGRALWGGDAGHQGHSLGQERAQCLRSNQVTGQRP